MSSLQGSFAQRNPRLQQIRHYFDTLLYQDRSCSVSNREFDAAIQFGVWSRELEACWQRNVFNMESASPVFPIIGGGIQANSAETAGHRVHILPDGEAGEEWEA